MGNFITGRTLDLNTLHRRVGGTSETQCSLNDTDILALRTSSSSAQAISSFQGTADYEFTIEAGGDLSANWGYNDADGTDNDYGTTSLPFASLNDIRTGYSMIQLAWIVGLTNEPVQFRMTQTSGSTDPFNSGWEHLVIGDTDFYRFEGSYSESSGDMIWQWATDPANAAAQQGVNPFNTSGTTDIKIR